MNTLILLLLGAISYDMSVSTDMYNMAPVQVEQIKTSLCKRYAGGHWTWPGDLFSHLFKTHEIDASGLSHQQMVQVHDNVHNNHGHTGLFRNGKEIMARMPGEPRKGIRND